MAITGTTGNDFLQGTQGADQIDGNQGNDTLHGGKGNDTVAGGEGYDIIWGDRGTDFLIGGFGNDVFVLDNRDTASSILAEADVIADFNQGDRNDVVGGGLGRDILGLTGGIMIDDLVIFDGSGEFEGDTIIQDRVTGKYLGIIQGIDQSQFTGEDFTTSIIPIYPSLGLTNIPSVLVPTPFIPFGTPDSFDNALDRRREVD